MCEFEGKVLPSSTKMSIFLFSRRIFLKFQKMLNRIFFKLETMAYLERTEKCGGNIVMPN